MKFYSSIKSSYKYFYRPKQRKINEEKEQQTNMGVKFQTKEMERTVVYRFKSQKVMKYNFKQKRWKKRKS